MSANFCNGAICSFQVFLVRKNQGKDAGTLYAMKVLKKATLKGKMLKRVEHESAPGKKISFGRKDF